MSKTYRSFLGLTNTTILKFNSMTRVWPTILKSWLRTVRVKWSGDPWENLIRTLATSSRNWKVNILSMVTTETSCKWSARRGLTSVSMRALTKMRSHNGEQTCQWSNTETREVLPSWRCSMKTKLSSFYILWKVSAWPMWSTYGIIPFVMIHSCGRNWSHKNGTRTRKNRSLLVLHLLLVLSHQTRCPKLKQ